jgi:peptidoglycan hydrolase-like protein with peptidoglycan-binding domain
LFQNGETSVGQATLGDVFKNSDYTPLAAAPLSTSDVTYTPASDTPYVPGSKAGGEQAVNEVYNSNSYRSQTATTGSNNYEKAYADADYAALMAQQKAADTAAAAEAAVISARLVSGNEAALQSALDTAYGDVDLSTRPSVAGHPIEQPTEAEIAKVYGASDYQAVTQGLQPVDVVTLYGPTNEAQAMLIAQARAKAAALEEDPPPDSEVTFGAQDIETARQGAELAKKAAKWPTEISPDSLEAAFSAVGTIQRRKLTDEERAVLLQLIYSSDYINLPDETDQSGITAVEDDTASIKPAV